ncbi:MAG: hypothetical protein ACREDZ_12640 [Kiloniellales bacterium]
MADKFLFDTQFESPKAKVKVPPAPHFDRTDLDRAHAEGVSQGRNAALAEAKSSQEAAIGVLLQKLNAGVGQLLADHTEAALAAERHGLEVARAALSKLFPRLNREQGLAEIAAVIEACLTRLREEPRLVVRVSDGTLDALRARLGAITESASFAGKIVMIAEDRLKTGDVVVEWADGGAERNQGQLWQTVEELVRRGLGPRAGDRPSMPLAQGKSVSADASPPVLAPECSDDTAEQTPAGDESTFAVRGN